MILFDIGFNVVVGASVAWTSGPPSTRGALLRSPALWALMAFELTLVAPVAAYLGWRFPEWRLLGLSQADVFSRHVWVAVGPCAGLLGFVVVRWLAAARRRVAAFALPALFTLATCALGYGASQEPELGATSAREVGRGLVWLVGAACGALALGWAVLLWRLWLLRRSGTRRGAEVFPAPLRDGHTKPLEAKKRVGKK